MSRNTKRNGKSYMGLYYQWKQMLYRCSKPHHARWKYYGGRGISVCAEWLDDFDRFEKDMGHPPKGMSIDRINNDGNYNKENCRWASDREQQSNRRDNIRITYGGETLCLEEWARKKNMDSRTLMARYKRRVSLGNLFKPTKSGYTNWNEVARKRRLKAGVK